MNIYLTVILGWIIGQITFTVICAYLLQRTKSTINYPTAIVVYGKAETGGYAIAICALAIVLFVMSDYIDLNLDRKVLIAKAALTFPEKFILFARSYSIVFGIFCQFLLLLVFKKGLKAINDYAAKNAIDSDAKINIDTPSKN